MSGLTLTIPDLFDVRVSQFVMDAKGRMNVILEVRQTIGDPPSDWKQAEPLRVGDTLKLNIVHESSGKRT